MKSKSLPLLVLGALLLITAPILNSNGTNVTDFFQGLMTGIGVVTACLGLYVFAKERRAKQ